MGSRRYLVLALAIIALGNQAAAHDGEPPPPGWHQDVPNGPVSIDGILVSGHLDAVSLADVRQAITAFQDIGLHKLASLSVIGKDEIRGYLEDRDLGWFTAKRGSFVWPDRSEHSGWDAYGQGLPEDLAALDFIKSAPQIFVFPVTDPLIPHRDDEHMRLIGTEAHSRLVALLGSKDHWFQGFNDLMYPDKESGNVGFVFRNGSDELTLFFEHSDVVVGTFNGQHLAGTLKIDPTDKLGNEVKAWEAKYAQPELARLAVLPPASTRAAPRDVILVDDVNAIGDLGAVSESELHDAKSAFRDAGLSNPDFLRVMGKDEIHAYLSAPDVILGWMTAWRVSCAGADSNSHSCWHASQQHLPEYADALRCIQEAQLVYVFPITTARGPRLDAPHLRLLDDSVRRELANVLGAKEAWTPGSAGTALAPRGPTTNIGFKFLDGSDEVILYFSTDDKVQGTFNGEYMSGDLVERAAQAFEKWKDQYAKVELAAHD